MTAKAFNYQGALLGSKTQKQPFAVVNYAPYFKYFTYMEYNSKNSSAYERPFVTLVRYDGNNPGYSYGGDANTAPITAVNDTRERALINSFNFTTVGWGVKANLTSGDISQDLSFWNQTAINLGTKTTNATYPVLTFAQRIVKFYFTSDVRKDSGLHGAGARILQRHRAGRLKGLRRRQLRAVQHVVPLPAFLLQRVHHGLHLRAFGPRPFRLGQHLSRDA